MCANMQKMSLVDYFNIAWDEASSFDKEFDAKQPPFYNDFNKDIVRTV